MAKKKSKRSGSDIYAGVDVGAGHFKVELFEARRKRRQLIPLTDWSQDPVRTRTPELSAEGFINQVRKELIRQGSLPAEARCGYALCMPVRRTDMGHQCGPSYNLNIKDPFVVADVPVIGDGRAHTLGTYAIGVARGRKRELVLFGFGTGVAGGSLFSRADNGLELRGREAHFKHPVSGVTWEDLTNEAALRGYLRGSGFDIDDDDPVGPFCQARRAQEQSRDAALVRSAIRCWLTHVAWGLDVTINSLNFGGEGTDGFLLVLSGGLSCLIGEPEKSYLYDQIFESYRRLGHEPWFGINSMEIVVENEGRRTACVGAAMVALAHDVGCEPTEVEVVVK